MAERDGGPAFPHGVLIREIDTYGGNQYEDRREFEPGISVRDFFAASVVSGLVASYGRYVMDQGEEERFARFAYKTADAMLAERTR